MLSMRLSLHVSPLTHGCLFLRRKPFLLSTPRRSPRNLCSSFNSILHNGLDPPLSGVDDAMMDYIFGKKNATEVAHLVWRHVVKEGDAVVDATCGNGYDTLAMLKLVADRSSRARVYGMDIQKDALKNTSWFLDASVDPHEKELVKLFDICHSKMEEVVPKGAPVRLVAFNLGYLPGSDKAITTMSETTLLALEAARRILLPGGLISVVVYVGHPGGRHSSSPTDVGEEGVTRKPSYITLFMSWKIYHSKSTVKAIWLLE